MLVQFAPHVLNVPPRAEKRVQELERTEEPCRKAALERHFVPLTDQAAVRNDCQWPQALGTGKEYDETAR